MASCIGCNCTDDRACASGCHWLSHNPPVCSNCVSLFDEAEFSGPAFENVVGANDDTPIACPHTKRLYVDSITFKCCGCDTLFCDEAA